MIDTTRAIFSAPEVARLLRRSTACIATAAAITAMLGTTFVAPPAVVAQDDDITARVEKLSQEGAKLYRNGEYKKAITKFEAAYNLSPVSTLLYNVALCHEKLGNRKSAIATLKKFIVLPDADSDIRSKALERIDRLEQELANAAVNTIPDESNGSGTEVSNNGGENTDGTGKGNDGKGNEGKTDKDGLGSLGVTGIILTGAGVAMAGAGLVFGLMADGNAEDFDNTFDAAERATLKEDAESNALLADIFYGAGAVSAITGLVLILVDVSDDGTESRSEGATVVPWMGRGGVWGAAVEIPLDVSP